MLLYFLIMADNQRQQVNIKNKKSSHEFEFLEKFIAGIQLTGTEIKSIKAGKASLVDSYCYFHAGELYLKGMHVSEYWWGTYNNHDPKRDRKLLLHKKEINRFYGEMEKKHLTMVPLMVYFDKRWIKVELGLGKGMKKYDKREKIAAQETKRRLAQIMKDRNR